MKKKNVISFSIWGKEERYLRGAIKNLEKAKVFYPGWTVRFYYQEDMSEALIYVLKQEGCELIPKKFFRDPWFGLYWRFCPMYDDASIDRFIVRDTDSRLSERESDAVQEWIDSGADFHIMRDNRAHNIYICGGMWGAKANSVPRFEEMMNNWINGVKGNTNNPRTKFHGTDQDFLCQKVWPLIKNSHMAHVAPNRGLEFTGRERPFRIENPTGYKVGT